MSSLTTSSARNSGTACSCSGAVGYPRWRGGRPMTRLYTSYWKNEALALPPHDKALKLGISRGGPRWRMPYKYLMLRSARSLRRRAGREPVPERRPGRPPSGSRSLPSSSVSSANSFRRVRRASLLHYHSGRASPKRYDERYEQEHLKIFV